MLSSKRKHDVVIMPNREIRLGSVYRSIGKKNDSVLSPLANQACIGRGRKRFSCFNLTSFILYMLTYPIPCILMTRVG